MSAALVMFPAVLPKVYATASTERPLPPGGNEGLQPLDGNPRLGSLAEGPKLKPSGGSMGLQPHVFGAGKKGFSPGSLASAAHKIGPARVVPMPPAPPAPEPLRTLTPNLAFYRKYTEAMLRRYMKMSMESGRVPSLLGRELFPGNVTNYKVSSFEDVVIFVHDIGNCLKLLNPTQQELIKRIALQEYSQGEVAHMLGMSLRSVLRQYAETLDELTGFFLKRKMLEPLKAVKGSDLVENL